MQNYTRLKLKKNIKKKIIRLFICFTLSELFLKQINKKNILKLYDAIGHLFKMPSFSYPCYTVIFNIFIIWWNLVSLIPMSVFDGVHTRKLLSQRLYFFYLYSWISYVKWQIINSKGIPIVFHQINFIN